MGHLVLKGGGLKSPDSQQPPAGRGHGVNQRCLNGITRLKLENERGSQIVEAARRFLTRFAYLPEFWVRWIWRRWLDWLGSDAGSP